MEVKNKKWLKYIGGSAVVLLLIGSVIGSIYDDSKGPKKQKQAKTDTETTETPKTQALRLSMKTRRSN